MLSETKCDRVELSIKVGSLDLRLEDDGDDDAVDRHGLAENHAGGGGGGGGGGRSERVRSSEGGADEKEEPT